jgi:hypothetical protein
MRRVIAFGTLLIGAGAVVGATSLRTSAIADQQVGIDQPARAAPGDLSLPVCHAPGLATLRADMIRLAQPKTEVPPAEMKAATPAPTFADTDPPLWEGLGSVTYKITTSNLAAQ